MGIVIPFPAERVVRPRTPRPAPPPPPPADSDAWQDDAACLEVDPMVFFRRDTTEAKTYCARCPVRVECLEAAIVGGDRFGVRGGLSERERRRLLRRRAAVSEVQRPAR